MKHSSGSIMAKVCFLPPMTHFSEWVGRLIELNMVLQEEAAKDLILVTSRTTLNIQLEYNY